MNISVVMRRHKMKFNFKINYDLLKHMITKILKAKTVSFGLKRLIAKDVRFFLSK